MIHETAAWLDALYGRCTGDDGEIVIIHPNKKQLVSVHPVGSGRALVDVANVLDGKPDHYLKINLMDAQAMRERSRAGNRGRHITGNMSEVKTIVSFHLDVDAGKSSDYHSRPVMLRILDQMPHPPTLIVNSDGDAGGFHAYWILREPHRIVDDADRERIATSAMRWQQRLNKHAGGKLDSTANIDRVLRVVGQSRSSGNFVTCAEYDPAREYTLEDLRLPPEQSDIEKAVTQEVRRFTKDTLSGGFDSSAPPITAYIESARITPTSLLREAGYAKISSDGKAWIRKGSQTGARTLKLSDDHEGINVFSGGDPLFGCLDDAGSPGKFHSTAAMFVAIRHAGSWEAAAKWCGEQLAIKFFFKGKAG